MTPAHAPVIVSNKDWQDLIGIQFALGGSNPKTGLNCYGLVREVYKGLQIELPEHQETALDAGLAVTAAGNDWTQLDEPRPFAVALIRSEGTASMYHLAIVTPELKLLHSLPKKGVIVSDISGYAPRILGFYAYTPGEGERLPFADGDVGRMIGTLAIVAATIYTGGAVGAIFESGFIGAMAAAAVSVGGNMILNVIAPIQPEGEQTSGKTGDLSDTRTYSWDGVQNDSRQGTTKAMVFGAIKVGGQIITEKTWFDHLGNEYLDMLLCPAVGMVSRLKSVQLNDTDIDLYKNSGWDYCHGGDEQRPLQWFDKIYLQYSSSAKIPYDASTTAPTSTLQFTTKAATAGIKLLLTAPSGIYQMVSNVPSGYSVTVRAQYRQHGSSTWLALPCFDPSASTNHALIHRQTGDIPNTGTSPNTLTDTGANFTRFLTLGQSFELRMFGVTYYCVQTTSNLTANSVTFNSFSDAGHTTPYPIWMTGASYWIADGTIIPYEGYADFYTYPGGPAAWQTPLTAFVTTANIKGFYLYFNTNYSPANNTTVSIVYKLASSSTWIEADRFRLISGMAPRYIEKLGLPAGLYHVALTMGSFGAWTADFDNFWFSDITLDTSTVDGVFVVSPVTGNAAKAANLQIEYGGMTEAQYDVRLWRTTVDQTAVDYQDDVYLRSYSEINYRQLAYPNHTLLGIRAMGTDRLSGGRPKVTSVAVGKPLTVPTTKYATTIIDDLGIVTDYTVIVGYDVTGLHKLQINAVLTDNTDPDWYWMVVADSAGYAQSDRLLTKHVVRAPVWEISGGHTYIYIQETETFSAGTNVIMFKETIDPYVHRRTAWAVAKMLIEGSHGRITENNIDWDAFAAWDIWNMERNKNLFNVNDPDIVSGYFIYYSTGTLSELADHYATGYIPVIGGVTYTISSKNQMAWYDKNKVYVSGSSQLDTNKTQTAPVTAKYLRCSVYSPSGQLATFQVEVGSTQTAYEAYNPAKVEPRHLYDAVIDFNTDLWSLAMKAAQTARGNIYKRGNKYSVWIDKVASHVQLFGEGNSNNVSVNPIPRSDRANILTTSFLDEAANYDQKDISRDDVQGSEYPIVKNIPTQVGAVRESQVTALLDYMLLQNRYVGSAISLEAGIDSIEVSVGNVFMVASQAKDFSLSGRLVNVNTSTVELDQPFTPEVGITYQLTVWGTDGTLYTWSSTLAGTDITSITKPTGLPSSEHYEYPYVLCKLTEERMKYRCIGIRRSADTMHATLTGIEYRPEVYAND
jgi:hypothetical protein